MIVLQLVSPYKGWVIIAGGFGGVFLLSFLWARGIKRGLKMEREMRFGWMQVGDHIQERISLDNNSRFPALWVKIIDHSEMPGYSISKVTSLRKNWFTHWFTHGICQQRGIYTLGPTSLESEDPLGIFKVRIDYPETVTMIVVPPVVPLPKIEIASGGQAGEGKSTSSGLERTIAAGGVREYQPGDSLRWMHWPTTARKSAPYVRLFDFSPAGNWWVLLDMDPRVQIGSGLQSTEEYGVILAASLVHEGLANNRLVGLITHGEDLIWHPPDRGNAQLWKILRSLAVIRPQGPPLHQLLRQAHLNLEERASLIVITANLTPSWVDSLGLLQRRGIVPTILLLNPSVFSRRARADRLAEHLLQLGVKHYLISEELDDVDRLTREQETADAAAHLRQQSRALKKQTANWRSLG